VLQPTAIKLGQWASTRPDLFDPTFCVQISRRLHASVTPHPPEHSRRMLLQALSSDGLLGGIVGGGGALTLEDVFESIDLKRTLGSGCVAQVHKATLRRDVANRAWEQAAGAGSGSGGDGRRDVVVKILHPGVEESVAMDMALLEAGCYVLTEVRNPCPPPPLLPAPATIHV